MLSLGAHVTIIGMLGAAVLIYPQQLPDEVEQPAQVEIAVGTNAPRTGGRSTAAIDLLQPQSALLPTSTSGVPPSPARLPGPDDAPAVPPTTALTAIAEQRALPDPSAPPPPAPPPGEAAWPASQATGPEPGAPAVPQEAGKGGAPPQIRVGDGIAITAAEIEGAGVVRPAKSETGNVPPEYPVEAARRGERGTVVLQIYIAADGSVTRVSVLRSSGSDLLDRAARERIETWHFEPARRDGQPVPDVEEQSIRFLPE